MPRHRVGPWLRGEAKRPEPSVGMARTDGIRLLYPGKEHSIAAEMEGGKSWIANACAAVELLAGNTVVYIHGEEADPADPVERLQVLGVPSDLIAAGFRSLPVSSAPFRSSSSSMASTS